MDKEVEKMPGALWNFSQPISDNMEEAVSGVKGELATKIFGDDLKVLEQKSDEIVAVMRKVPGIADLGVFRVLGQPNLNVVVDRQAAARYQVNVADVQDAIQTAVGGNALTQVLKGEARYDLVMRYLPNYRNTKEAIEDIRLLSARVNEFLSRSFARSAWPTALRKYIAKEIRAILPSNTAFAAAIWAVQWKKLSRK